MQVTLGSNRAAVKAPHEAYRQRLLELEKQRLDAIAAQEAAAKAEQEKSVTDKKAAAKKSPRSPVAKKK
jgi:hypothetical protein